MNKECLQAQDMMKPFVAHINTKEISKGSLIHNYLVPRALTLSKMDNIRVMGWSLGNLRVSHIRVLQFEYSML